MNDISPQKCVKVDVSDIIDEFNSSIYNELSKSIEISKIYEKNLMDLIFSSKEHDNDKETVRILEKIYYTVTNHNEILKNLLIDTLLVHLKSSTENTTEDILPIQEKDNQMLREILTISLSNSTETTIEDILAIQEDDNQILRKIQEIRDALHIGGTSNPIPPPCSPFLKFWGLCD